MKHSKSGFTLLETLVAMILTLILAGLLTKTVSDTSCLWRLNSQRLDTFLEARMALQNMTSDLSSLPTFPAAHRALAVLCTTPHPQKKPSSILGIEFSLLTQSPSPDHSDIRAVGYFCSWDTTLNGPVLRRQTASPEVTIESLCHLDSNEAPLFPWNVLPRDAPSEILAQFAWDLRLLIPNPSPSALPSSAEGLRFNSHLPAWIEIRFKAVSPSALPGTGLPLSDPRVWASEPLFAGIPHGQKRLHQHVREFVTRIPLAP